MLDTAQVLSIFGDTPFSRRVEVLEAVAADDAAGAVTAVDSAITSGVDARRLADDLLKTLRDAFVLAAAARPRSVRRPRRRDRAAPRARRGVRARGAHPRHRDARADDRRRPRAECARSAAPARGRDRAPRASRVARLRSRRCSTGSSGSSTRSATAPARPRVRHTGFAAPSRPAAACTAEGRGTRRAVGRTVAPTRRRCVDIRTPSGEGEAAAAGRTCATPHDRGRPTARPSLGPRRPPEPPARNRRPRPESSTAPFTLDDVILAWSATLAGSPPPLRGRDPGRATDRGRRKPHHVRRARGAARGDQQALPPGSRRDQGRARVRARADARNSGCVKHDFDAPDAFGARATAPPVASRAAAAPTPPTKARSTSASWRTLRPSDAPLDSQARLIETFGAQVVEERPRT